RFLATAANHKICFREAGAGGSNPLTPTILSPRNRQVFRAARNSFLRYRLRDYAPRRSYHALTGPRRPAGMREIKSCPAMDIEFIAGRIAQRNGRTCRGGKQPGSRMNSWRRSPLPPDAWRRWFGEEPRRP